MAFLKTALLYFDKIRVLSSEYAIREANREFASLLHDGELIEWVNGDEIAFRYEDILRDAVSTDLSDTGFLS